MPMKKRVAIVILLAVATFMLWRWKQATTVVVVDGVAESGGRGLIMPGVYVDVDYGVETGPDGKKIAKVCKARVVKLETVETQYISPLRFTLEVSSADAEELLKGRKYVLARWRQQERSRLAEWLDSWFPSFAKRE
jgi:hypothetical protein